jgi:hypothetical protein
LKQTQVKGLMIFVAWVPKMFNDVVFVNTLRLIYKETAPSTRRKPNGLREKNKTTTRKLLVPSGIIRIGPNNEAQKVLKGTKWKINTRKAGAEREIKSLKKNLAALSIGGKNPINKNPFNLL